MWIEHGTNKRRKKEYLKRACIEATTAQRCRVTCSCLACVQTGSYPCVVVFICKKVVKCSSLLLSILIPFRSLCGPLFCCRPSPLPRHLKALLSLAGKCLWCLFGGLDMTTRGLTILHSNICFYILAMAFSGKRLLFVVITCFFSVKMPSWLPPPPIVVWKRKYLPPIVLSPAHKVITSRM